MEHLRTALGWEDGGRGGGGSAAAVPEELRCKRSDGKQWRCSAPSMPNKTMCEKHYAQSKRNVVKPTRHVGATKPGGKRLLGEGVACDAFSWGRSRSKVNDDGETASLALQRHEPIVQSSPLSLVQVGNKMQLQDNIGRFSSLLKDAACHQCRIRAKIVWCISCDRRGYCGSCILGWYSDIPVDDLQKVCPACRGVCNCRVCMRVDSFIKSRVQEMATLDVLRYLHGVLVCVLPVLKKIYADQCIEIGVETKAYGPKADIPRAKLNIDEQMCCDFCQVPIFDYHRHCTTCSYDLCLNCCRDLRRLPTNPSRAESKKSQGLWKNKDLSAVPTRIESPTGRIHYEKSFSKSEATNHIDFTYLYPTWKFNSDGKILCGPIDAGGCGSGKLILRRIFKINWIAKLLKNAEEIVNCCDVSNAIKAYECYCCNDTLSSESTCFSNSRLSLCHNEDTDGGKFFYSPMLEDFKHEGIDHFLKHWARGEPVVVRQAFDRSLSSSWDPLSIWRGILETLDEKMDEKVVVKAVNCLDQSEVDIELHHFIKGYSDGCRNKNGQPQILKLSNWPPPGVLEEFLLCQRPEFVVNFPLVDFIHYKWGLLNLTAKLPCDALQPEIGPKLLIAYGSSEETMEDFFITNLKVNMCDVVYMLMHTAKVPYGFQNGSKPEHLETDSDVGNMRLPQGNPYAYAQNTSPVMRVYTTNMLTKGPGQNQHPPWLRISGETPTDSGQCNGLPPSSVCGSSIMDSGRVNTAKLDSAHAGVIWDVFSRHDILKLNEYLIANWEDLSGTHHPVSSVKYPIYDQAVHLNTNHIRILKNDFGVEPWSIRQDIGEAVFIPAGCPFQFRNLQSSVQLAFDFLSPESLSESSRLTQEIRCLPNDHEAKLGMLEVGKMSFYAASSAVREIQRISLDPKMGLDTRFNDKNLTAAVSENLVKLAKHRRLACS